MSGPVWIQTYTGKRFCLDPIDQPVPDEIDIEDIAHALAHLCRWTGHTRGFYSVAQHSVLVSEIVPPSLVLEGLLHDAAEAYLGDVSRPLKALVPEYRALEARLEHAIAVRFGLRFPWPDAVKEADARVLITERRDLLRNTKETEWGGSWPEPLVTTIVPWTPEASKEQFLRRFGEWVDRWEVPL